MLIGIASQIDDARHELQRLVDGSFGDVLRTIGVGRALQRTAGIGAQSVVVVTNDVEWLPDHVALVTYFACNEAIQNAMKHAGPAATIDVDIRLLDDQNGSRVEFSVADDGVGCDQGRLEAGHGIRALSHRLDEVGGALVATSEPGCGTRLTGTIPVMR